MTKRASIFNRLMHGSSRERSATSSIAAITAPNASINATMTEATMTNAVSDNSLAITFPPPGPSTPRGPPEAPPLPPTWADYASPSLFEGHTEREFTLNSVIPPNNLEKLVETTKIRKESGLYVDNAPEGTVLCGTYTDPAKEVDLDRLTATRHHRIWVSVVPNETLDSVEDYYYDDRGGLSAGRSRVSTLGYRSVLLPSLPDGSWPGFPRPKSGQKAEFWSLLPDVVYLAEAAHRTVREETEIDSGLISVRHEVGDGYNHRHDPYEGGKQVVNKDGMSCFIVTEFERDQPVSTVEGGSDDMAGDPDEIDDQEYEDNKADEHGHRQGSARVSTIRFELVRAAGRVEGSIKSVKKGTYDVVAWHAGHGVEIPEECLEEGTPMERARVTVKGRRKRIAMEKGKGRERGGIVV